MDKIFDEVTGLTKNENVELIQAEARKNCEDFIFRPRRNRNSKEKKKFVFVSNWDPRNPDFSQILRENRDTLYRDPQLALS